MQNNIKILRYNTSCLCFYDKTSLKYLFVGIRYLFESVDVQSEMQLEGRKHGRFRRFFL